LVVPRYRLQTVGGQSFSATAPNVWYALPIELRQSESLNHFKSLLKTHFFKLTFTC
ncbi:hypothetical protein CAPTEDRAFT_95123, partial [Capitella teleta]